MPAAEYTTRVDNQILKAAETAFAGLSEAPAERQAQAVADREQLYSWLMQVGRAVQEPASLLSEEFLIEAENNLAGVFNSDPQYKQVLKAWKDLPDAAAQAALRAVLRVVFESASQGLVMSRQAEDRPWEATGFYADSSVKAVSSKVGTHPYQPIGYDDGKQYIPLGISKMLWRREWSVALVLPFSPAFVVKEDPGAKVAGAMTHSERERIDGWAQLLRRDLEELKDKDLADPDVLADVEFKIRESVKLARIQIPRLDQIMMDYERAHPEIGEFFCNVPYQQLATSCCEFLQAQLDSDSARQLVERTILSIPTDAKTASTLASAKLRLEQLLADAQPDGDVVNGCISELAVAIPALREVVLALQKERQELSAVEGARELLKWLDQATPPK